MVVVVRTMMNDDADDDDESVTSHAWGGIVLARLCHTRVRTRTREHVADDC